MCQEECNKEIWDYLFPTWFTSPHQRQPNFIHPSIYPSNSCAAKEALLPISSLVICFCSVMLCILIRSTKTIKFFWLLRNSLWLGSAIAPQRFQQNAIATLNKLTDTFQLSFCLLLSGNESVTVEKETKKNIVDIVKILCSFLSFLEEKKYLKSCRNL